ncbi:hypothetical protein IST495A_06008 [Burkholderia multivorans]|nr:hypothetical protein IST495A_06008 [Burkholderia multivorans]
MRIPVSLLGGIIPVSEVMSISIKGMAENQARSFGQGEKCEEK